MKISVVIPVFNSSKLLKQTLQAISSGSRAPDELIVVDDHSTDDSAAIAEQFDAHVIVMAENVGPAACRNHAALYANGDILVYLDADTCVHSDTLERIHRHFVTNPGLTAIIGSYDDTPSDPGLCSQYRNLAHCYVHHSANRSALTFWSGCGAIRRTAFIEAAGFDERYRRPSIEDIEFGYRITDSGAHILLDPEVCVTHTKRWTLSNSIRTDVFDRGIPWMVLLLKRRRMPNDLNLKKRHRIATALTGSALLCLAFAIRSTSWILPSVVLATLALCMDIALLNFIFRKRGLKLAVVAGGMTLIQNICKLIAAIAGSLVFIARVHPYHSRHGGHQSRILPEATEAAIGAQPTNQ
jgi:glycosyltransferase involved in cell wall biosynthesis